MKKITTTVLIKLCTQVSKVCVIGRAKPAPHWDVQSKFHMIYMCRFVCPPYVKKMHGRYYVAQARA